MTAIDAITYIWTASAIAGIVIGVHSMAEAAADASAVPDGEVIEVELAQSHVIHESARVAIQLVFAAVGIIAIAGWQVQSLTGYALVLAEVGIVWNTWHNRRTRRRLREQLVVDREVTRVATAKSIMRDSLKSDTDS